MLAPYLSSYIRIVACGWSSRCWQQWQSETKSVGRSLSSSHVSFSIVVQSAPLISTILSLRTSVLEFARDSHHRCDLRPRDATPYRLARCVHDPPAFFVRFLLLSSSRPCNLCRRINFPFSCFFAKFSSAYVLTRFKKAVNPIPRGIQLKHFHSPFHLQFFFFFLLLFFFSPSLSLSLSTGGSQQEAEFSKILTPIPRCILNRILLLYTSDIVVQ